MQFFCKARLWNRTYWRNRQWQPGDPTFYPSPRMEMQAPREQLAYVVVLNSNGNGRLDALAVMDVDSTSSTYQHVVGRVELNVGDVRD